MLNKNVPCKKHHHQSNQMSFLNKELSKAIRKHLDCIITLLRIEMMQIGDCTQSKEITVSHL